MRNQLSWAPGGSLTVKKSAYLPSQGSPCPCPYPSPYSSLAERLGPTLVTSLFPSSRQERNRTVHIIQSAFLYFYKENSFILARKVYQLRGGKSSLFVEMQGEARKENDKVV